MFLPEKGPGLLANFYQPFSVAAATVFAGKPAPTQIGRRHTSAIGRRPLQERVYPRKGRHRPQQNPGSGLCLWQPSSKDRPCLVQAT
ncbi:hypothetical protein DZA28_21855 [Pseudomonas alloputida]|uniref:Diguanylate cyclase n=2 Tax=Pseudomonas TaxID=286 RepID=A0ABD6N875_9PSED|nr:hypothetical protein [Pseudomonas hunanensis]PTV52788.1 hypothetical protein DBL03_24485 [Pseudomonas putida]TRZ62439.1 hypothetical protein DZA28_21855 [Pseudomonas alloputida]